MDIFLRQGNASATTVQLYDPTASPATNVTVSVNGVSSAGVLGLPSVSAGALIAATGQVSAGAAGSASVQIGANAQPAGVASSSAVGYISATGDCLKLASGVSGAGAVGQAQFPSEPVVVTPAEQGQSVLTAAFGGATTIGHHFLPRLKFQTAHAGSVFSHAKIGGVFVSTEVNQTESDEEAEALMLLAA